VIRLENMESLEPAGLFEQAQAELEDLAAAMRADGLEVYVAGPDESVHSILQESADQVAVDVLNVVLEHALDETIALVIGLVIGWARRRRCFRDRDGARATVCIWGPNYEVLKVVELPPPEDGDRRVDGELDRRAGS
jgi:hypothetical protein